MNKQTEALKLALEALINTDTEPLGASWRRETEAIIAIREALAEQEAVLPGGGHVPAVPVAVYGYCPECGGAGVMRERRPNGDDKCTNGHKYPSSKALAEQPAQQPVAWSPRLDYSGYADKRVWANGKPKQEDIEYWSKNGGGVDVAYTSPQPAQQTCLVANEPCKHDSWCSEVYCQEHCKFVEQPAPVAEPHKQPEPCQCPECQVTPHASDCAVHNEPAYPNGACNCRAQPVQEPVAYDKTELNCFAQDLYDKKMREGKHGHYESMFHVIHQCIKKVAPPANKPLTDEEIDNLPWGPHEGNPMTFAEGLRDFARAIEAKLKEKNA